MKEYRKIRLPADRVIWGVQSKFHTLTHTHCTTVLSHTIYIRSIIGQVCQEKTNTFGGIVME